MEEKKEKTLLFEIEGCEVKGEVIAEKDNTIAFKLHGLKEDTLFAGTNPIEIEKEFPDIKINIGDSITDTYLMIKDETWYLDGCY